MELRAGFTKNYVKRLPALFPCDWDTAPANWSVTGGTKVGVNPGFRKASTQALEILVTSNSCNLDRSAGTFSAGVRPTVGLDAVIGLWVYLESPNGQANGPSNAYINLVLANVFNFADAKTFGFAGNHLKWNQWNYLVAHSGETGAWNAQGTGSSAWTTAGAGSFTNPVHTVQLNLGNMNGARVYVDSIDYGGRSRPKIIFGFDGISSALVSSILPLAQAADIPCFACFNGVGSLASSIGSTKALKAAGWEIINHGYTHAAVGTMTEDEPIVTEVEANWSMMVREGLILPRQEKIFIAPEASLSPRAKKVLGQLGYVVCRGYKGFSITPTQYGVDNLLDVGGFDIGNPTSLARLLALADAPVKYGATGWLFAHDVNTSTGQTGPTGNNNTIYIDDLTAVFAKFVTLRREGKVDLVQPSQWYRGLANPRNG